MAQGFKDSINEEENQISSVVAIANWKVNFANSQSAKWKYSFTNAKQLDM